MSLKEKDEKIKKQEEVCAKYEKEIKSLNEKLKNIKKLGNSNNK